MDDKREEDISPAQGLEEQQISSEVSALSRTPTPASICPVPSPVQRPIRIHQQRSHRKFLLAIPAVTVLAVAAVVLFYAITWNDSPPTTRNDDIRVKNEENSKKGRSDFGTDEGPNQRAAKTKKNEKKTSFTETNEKATEDSDEKVFEGPMLRRMPGDQKRDEGIKFKEVTTEETEDLFGSIPWPSYTDLNFTDDDLYAEEMLFKVDKLLSRKHTRQPFFIDLVESKRNFTDANEYCRQREGYLMQLFNVQEELYFTRVLTHSELFKTKLCDSGYLGYRRILQEEIKIKGVKVATFADPFAPRDIWVVDENDSLPHGDCVVLHHNLATGTFGLTRKPCETELSCYLCETARGCTAPSCYFWHYKMNTSVNYSEAKKFCKAEKDGTLARIRNKATLNLLKETLNVSTPNSLFNLYSEEACRRGYYVEKEDLGLGQMGFENMAEQQIAYKSPTALTLKPVAGKQCVSVSNEPGFRWVSISCTDLRCFFCRYDRV